LRWNDHVSWSRVADSLLYTGFSVPLLDWLVKTLLLDRGFNINTSTAPIGLYAMMALANGLYLSTHNSLRGLPRAAVMGNFFRSILSIPLAIGLNMAIGSILGMAGVVGINAILQKWAAIISKAASDCVAGLIEGGADRARNIQRSNQDYQDKLENLMNSYARLEAANPEMDVLSWFDDPKQSVENLGGVQAEDARVSAIHALDLLYFWWYQPRARWAWRRILNQLDDEERRILIRWQRVLVCKHEISQMFVDGLIGKNFCRGLAFYLERSGGYLRATSKQVERS